MNSDIQVQVNLFEARLSEAVGSARACARQLREVDDHDLAYLLAERLPVLGSVIVPEMQEIIADSSVDRDVRYLAARVAVEVGDRGEAVALLCEEVRNLTTWALPSAEVLGRSGIREAGSAIEYALVNTDPRDGVTVAGYLHALRRVKGVISARLREKLLTETDPWIAQLIEKEFPAGRSDDGCG